MRRCFQRARPSEGGRRKTYLVLGILASLLCPACAESTAEGPLEETLEVRGEEGPSVSQGSDGALEQQGVESDERDFPTLESDPYEDDIEYEEPSESVAPSTLPANEQDPRPESGEESEEAPDREEGPNTEDEEPENSSPEEATCNADLGQLPTLEGAFLAQGEEVSATREWCSGGMHASAGAAGSLLSLKLDAFPEGELAQVRVEDLTGNPLVDWSKMESGDSLTFSPTSSGEVLVRIEPAASNAGPQDYTLSVNCDAECDLEYTRYPVLLMHGMAGTETYLGILDYWFQLEDHLLPRGFNIQIRAVEAFQSTAIRGEAWVDHIEAMINQGVGRKFNLVGHSQGGIDARLVAATKSMTGRIASVVTISSPHHGSPTAEVATGTFEAFPVGSAVVEGITGLLGGLIGLDAHDLVEQSADFTPAAMEAFNSTYPDMPQVYYASYAGYSCGALDFACHWSNHGEIVDPLFVVTHTFTELAAGDNDGLVPVASAIWGDYQGTIPADHMDSVGQIADFINLSFDHKAFYLDEMRRLATLGF